MINEMELIFLDFYLSVVYNTNCSINFVTGTFVGEKTIYLSLKPHLLEHKTLLNSK